MTDKKLYTEEEITDFEILAIQEFVSGLAAGLVLNYQLDLDNMLQMIRETYSELISKGTLAVDKKTLAKIASVMSRES